MVSEQDIKHYIKKSLSQVSRQSYWLGIFVGILIGLALGFALGYSHGDRTVVIPLTQGIKT